MVGKLKGMSGASMEMPKYRCHKVVWALKIAEVEDGGSSGSHWLIPEDSRFEMIEVGDEYWEKYKPKTGGYYVVYKDGHKSFSSAEAFEGGHTAMGV